MPLYKLQPSCAIQRKATSKSLIELLRIVATIMIVADHCIAFHSGSGVWGGYVLSQSFSTNIIALN